MFRFMFNLSDIEDVGNGGLGDVSCLGRRLISLGTGMVMGDAFMAFSAACSESKMASMLFGDIFGVVGSY